MFVYTCFDIALVKFPREADAGDLGLKCALAKFSISLVLTNMINNSEPACLTQVIIRHIGFEKLLIYYLIGDAMQVFPLGPTYVSTFV